MLKIGQLFETYSDFQSEFENYKKTFFCDFSTSDCRTLTVARKKYPKKLEFTPDALKYYFIKFICIHGGTFKKIKKCEDIRSTFTMKQNCPAFIYVRVTSDGMKLSTKPKGKWFCPKCRGDRPNKIKPKAQLLKELECYNKEKEDKA